jgi:zinc/manganese transport system ATP-binding protein
MIRADKRIWAGAGRSAFRADHAIRAYSTENAIDMLCYNIYKFSEPRQASDISNELSRFRAVLPAVPASLSPRIAGAAHRCYALGCHRVGGVIAMSHGAICLKDVTVAYDRHPAVHHVWGAFEPGSMTAIAGPNGAGKSSLLKALMGELRPAAGVISRGGLAVRDLGYLPQAAEIERRFPLSVADTVLLGAWRRTGAFGGATPAIITQMRESLSAVGMEGFERRPISALSAGQFQRVLFARLLLQDARVIVLDEPFTAIDARTTRDLLELVTRWHGEGRTVIAVLHDFEQVRAHFPQTLLLAREVIAWGPTEATMSSRNLLAARAMAEAWDETAEVCRPGLENPR